MIFSIFHSFFDLLFCQRSAIRKPSFFKDNLYQPGIQNRARFRLCGRLADPNLYNFIHRRAEKYTAISGTSVILHFMRLKPEVLEEVLQILLMLICTRTWRISDQSKRKVQQNRNRKSMPSPKISRRSVRTTLLESNAWKDLHLSTPSSRKSFRKNWRQKRNDLQSGHWFFLRTCCFLILIILIKHITASILHSICRRHVQSGVACTKSERSQGWW